MTQGTCHIVLIGCGAMGGALLKGWLSSHTSSARFSVVTPRQTSVAPFLSDDRVRHFLSIDSLIESEQNLSVDHLFYAAKPYMTKDILPSYRPILNKDTVVLSVAAGKSFSHFKSLLGNKNPLVRVIPNTPSAIGEGVSLLVSDGLSEKDKDFVTVLMRAVGSVFWFDSEEELDRATLISGCGPAYLFSFIEALQEAGQSIGLSLDQSKALTRDMLLGALRYYQSEGREAKELRKEVTSPGGVTQAVLDVLRHENTGIFCLFLEGFAKGMERTAEIKEGIVS